MASFLADGRRYDGRGVEDDVPIQPEPNTSLKKAGTQRSVRRWESSETRGSGRRRCHRIFRLWSPIPHPESGIHWDWPWDGPRTSIPGRDRSILKIGRRS